MKKYLLLTLVACGMLVHANAQQAILEGVSSVSQPILKTRDGGALIYTSYKLNDGKHVVQRYTAQLMPMPAIEFVAPVGVTINSIELAGSGILVGAYDERKKTRLLYLVDEMGHVINEISDIDPIGYASFYTANPFEFLQLTKTNNGYEISKMNLELKTLWRQSYQYGNEVWNVDKVLSSSTYLYVLRSEQKDDRKDYVMQCIDVLSGKEMYTYNMSDRQKGAIPTAIKTTPGGIVVVGVLAKGAGKDDGVFYMALDHTGKEQHAGKVEADVLRNQLPKSFQPQEPLKLVVEGVADIHADNSIVLVAQAYKLNKPAAITDKKGKRKGEIAANVQVQLSDIIFFNFDRSGALLSAANLDAGKQEISLKNSPLEDYATINWLASNNLLSYESNIETRQSPNVLYKNVKGGNLQYYTVPFGDTVKANQVSIGPEIKVTTHEIDVNAYIPASGTLSTPEGVLIYSQIGQQLKIDMIPYR